MPRRRLIDGADEPTQRPAAVLPEGFGARAERLLCHPRFRPALAAYCRGMSRAAPIRWPYYKLFDQLGRYLVCFMMIHNYYMWRNRGGSPPTLSALQGVAGVSARQTAGFVAALKAGHLVAVERDPADRRATLLRPMPRVMFEIGRSMRLFVAATDTIEEPRPGRAALLEDPDMLGDMIARSGAYVLANGTLLHAFPGVLHFTLRDSGYPLLTAVMASHYDDRLGDTPSAEPLGRRALAERFQVSPAHVASLLTEAEAKGWFALGSGGRVAWVADAFLAEFEQWAAWQMAHFEGLWEADEVVASVTREAPVAAC